MKTKTHETTSTVTANGPILVLGGTGKTGRRIVQRLEERQLPVRVGSRGASVPFSWQDDRNWESVLEGVESLFIAYHPDLAVPGASEHIRKITHTARKAGVARIVLLSGRGEVEAQLCERIVLESGLSATVVRCSWFNQNFSESFFRDMILDGVVALPVGSIREPFVDADDIADVAVAALTEDGHKGEIYEVTGAELLSFDTIIETIGKESGRAIELVRIPREAFVEGLRDAQLPDEMVQLVDYLFTTVLDGRNEWLGDGVQRALGRKPKSFSAFAQEAAADGSWS